jgi:hypothetical protein
MTIPTPIPTKPATPAPPKYNSINEAIAAQCKAYRDEDAADNFRRVLVVGDSGAGKTWTSCTTAPTPCFILDINGQMAGVPEREGLFRVPITNMQEARKFAPQANDLMEAVEVWIRNYAPKMIQLAGDQTITVIVDSISDLGDDLMPLLEKQSAAMAKENKYWKWEIWANRWRDFSTLMRGTKCNFIVIAHEQAEYDDGTPPKIVGYRWYMPGNKFSPRFTTYFTDAVHAVRLANTPVGTVLSTIAFPSSAGGIKLAVQQKFFWKIQPEQLRPWIKTRSKSTDLLIPAGWDSLMKA